MLLILSKFELESCKLRELSVTENSQLRIESSESSFIDPRTNFSLVIDPPSLLIFFRFCFAVWCHPWIASAVLS
jgi:hypothetical protein